VCGQHLTIRKPLWQRVLGHFGEVSGKNIFILISLK